MTSKDCAISLNVVYYQTMSAEAGNLAVGAMVGLGGFTFASTVGRDLVREGRLLRERELIEDPIQVLDQIIIDWRGIETERNASTVLNLVGQGVWNVLEPLKGRFDDTRMVPQREGVIPIEPSRSDRKMRQFVRAAAAIEGDTLVLKRSAYRARSTRSKRREVYSSQEIRLRREADGTFTPEKSDWLAGPDNVVYPAVAAATLRIAGLVCGRMQARYDL